MELQARVVPNCVRCHLRPREEGGSGSCPWLTSVIYDIHLKRGDENGCGKFDPRPYYTPAERKAVQHHDQEERLF